MSLLVPLLAHEVRKYGASPTMVGLFLSIYGALQLLSSPLMVLFEVAFIELNYSMFLVLNFIELNYSMIVNL